MGFTCGLPECGVPVEQGGLCSQCREVHYCSGQHQKQHWKQHKKMCKEIASTKREGKMLPNKGTANSRDSEEVQKCDFVVKMMGAVGVSMGDITSFHEEYRVKFPRDSRGFAILKDQFNQMTMATLCKNKGIKMCVLDSYGTARQILSKRWKLEVTEFLLQFLRKQEGKFGEVWKEHPSLTMQQEYGQFFSSQHYQTMRNTHSQELVLERGCSYISIGFVDLQQVMEAEVEGCREAGPVVWRGYDMSAIAVARAKIILALLQQTDVPIEHILQLWYSSCISPEAAKFLQATCQKLAGAEQDQEVKELMVFWSSARVEREEAEVRWSQHLGESDLRAICHLSRKTDRVDYSRYLLTGQMFLPQGSLLYGNPTHFCLPLKYRGFKKTGENIFNTVKVESLVCSSQSLKVTMEERFCSLLHKFKKKMCAGDFEISLHVKTVSLGSASLFREIKKTNPVQIDWSNVPDYLPIQDFFLMARQCSGEATKHTLYLMNWMGNTFGCNLMDYVPYKENYKAAGFNLDSCFLDKRGSLNRMVKELAQELKEVVDKTVTPPFIHLDMEKLDNMEISVYVLGRRYMQAYMAFMVGRQELNSWEWKGRPFSLFSRANGTLDAAFAFKK